MKIFIYVNNEKDPNGAWLDNFIKILNNKKVEYEFFSPYLSPNGIDAIFVLGGDGTILGLTEYANINNIPIIGINAGKLGFLTEFEKEETFEAVELFVAGKLKKDERSTLYTEFNGKSYYALNDIVMQRTFNQDGNGLIINVSVSVDGKPVDKIRGDGVIISTPTGSTAYSLSAGGSILAPGINAFLMTPISAHSLHLRPVVFSADSTCEMALESGNKAGLFVDGKFISLVDQGFVVSIKKASNKTTFLRREESDFFKRLNKKFV